MTVKSSTQRILDRLKGARTQMEALIKDRGWIEDAKKAAEKQGREMKKMLDSDVAKLRRFIESERKELEKVQKQIPGEVKKLKAFVESQKKELSKLLNSASKGAGKTSKKGSRSKGAAKKAAASKKKKPSSSQGAKKASSGKAATRKSTPSSK
jgi:peptidoglycan hydrolase CwlO-like protein